MAAFHRRLRTFFCCFLFAALVENSLETHQIEMNFIICFLSELLLHLHRNIFAERIWKGKRNVTYLQNKLMKLVLLRPYFQRGARIKRNKLKVIFDASGNDCVCVCIMRAKNVYWARFGGNLQQHLLSYPFTPSLPSTPSDLFRKSKDEVFL